MARLTGICLTAHDATGPYRTYRQLPRSEPKKMNMNTASSANLSQSTNPGSVHLDMTRPAARWLRLAAFSLLALLATHGAGAFVYETEKEFYSTGDFNGDGQTDLVIVDKTTGRVRIGYRVSPEFFNWANWRSGGTRDVTGAAVGRLTDEKYDSLALASADANLLTLLDAPNPNVPADPVKIKTDVLGPNTVAAIDVGGSGNTPLLDLYVASIYNNDPENRVTLFRTGGEALKQITEQPAPGAESHGNRLSLKTGGPEFVATLVSSASGNSLRVEKLDSGKPEEVLNIGNLPAGVDYLVGNFRGAPTKDFVFYQSGEPTLLVSTIEEAGGRFKIVVYRRWNPIAATKQSLS